VLDLWWTARRPQHGGSDREEGHVEDFEFNRFGLKERELLSGRLKAALAKRGSADGQRRPGGYGPVSGPLPNWIGISTGRLPPE